MNTKYAFAVYLLFFLSGLNVTLSAVEVKGYQDENVTIQTDEHCGCHDGSLAPFVETHSSVTSNYGEWSIKCYTCHSIHHNEQVTSYGNESYIFEGISTNITGTTLSMAGAGWDTDQYRGYVLIANTAINSSLYKITGNTADTLNIGGSLNLNEAKAGDTFGIIYGKMIRTTISTPNNGTKNVKFFNYEGMNSFADKDINYDGICEVCHSRTAHFRNDGNASDQNHTNMGEVIGTKCTKCHKHVNGFEGMGGGAHEIHISANYGPKISCSDCHGAQSPPLLADGNSLENTTACDTCHSPGGAFDGVNDMETGARNNWAGVYNTNDNTLKDGKEKWCIGCHDDVPAIVRGNTAPNKAGDNITYGYYVTGHGRINNYDRMSWQDTAAAGNPGANRSCGECHDTASEHISNGTNPGSRLKPGFEVNQDNSNCNNCHTPGGLAVSDPQFYTNSWDYENSSHGNKNCTECHDVHGGAGPFSAMTRGNKENLCLECHSGQAGHALNVQFGKDGRIYNLQCTSCHNIHIITGMYNASNPDKSPISKLSNITEVWGDNAAEKMNALGGRYQTPKNDSLTGSQLPDYPAFCLDCHGSTEFGTHGGISWGNDEAHGLNSANEPNGYGTCPNWYACGKAEGWDLDLCIGNDTCWPVIPRGRGDQLFSRSAYNHEERIAGVNFVLSCSDCHITHESGIGSKLRSIVNGAPGSTTWNTMCNACHYYYSDWHAGMSCGSASCHVSDRMTNTGTNTLHSMSSRTGSANIRVFNPDLVADMRFENNLKDSGSFQMDGRWYSQYAGGGAGSFSSGKSGQAIQMDGNQPVELGTENSYWSTDAGYHGTWVYSEMKKNMTLEAWVYPTGTQAGGENHILSKHTYTEGGYALLLKSIGETLRPALLTNVNGGEAVWNSSDCNGLRGAFSSIPVPLNQWTHVAAVFDPDLPDRNPGDGSVGRIRIYVNGEDVTNSYPDASQCYAQPGTGENDMFPYSEMNIKNESRCYEGHWCASALSVGGLMWGNGSRKGLIGKIDEVKVWNVVKTSEYFESYDALSSPVIVKVEGSIDRDWIVVTFSEGVYTNTGQTGNLQSGDFNLVDADNSRTITGVIHNAGDSIATLTLSSPLDSSNDIDVDTIAAKSNSIYDEYNNSAETTPVTIIGQACPTGPAIFQLNESAGSTIAKDEENVIKGTVNDPVQSFTGDGYFHGDGSDNYIDFENNTQCMLSSTEMSLETRIKPDVVDSGGSSTIQRIFARDKNGNYQISVWRNNNSANFPNFQPPSGVASIAFWVKPVDNHGGDVWKPVLTNYTYYPIVASHWYKIKVVWDSGRTGAIPADIYVDDQGTDGNGTEENWEGYMIATDSNQSQLTPEKWLQEGDQISAVEGQFVVGANVNNHNNNVFSGLIDWITWKDSAD